CLDTLAPELDAHWHPEDIIRWHALSGQLHMLHGEYGRALTEFNTIRALCVERGLAWVELQVTLDVAHILIFLNHTHSARALLKKAKNLAHQRRDTTLVQRASLLQRLADANDYALGER